MFELVGSGSIFILHVPEVSFCQFPFEILRVILIAWCSLWYWLYVDLDVNTGTISTIRICCTP